MSAAVDTSEGDHGAEERGLFTACPSLRSRVPWLTLGDFPTPVEPLERTAARIGREGAPLFVKRDDLSSPIYGGNKVRTLEVLFGEARARGARRVYSTGAYGSNHALATAMHAPRVGLKPGAVLFPQPRSVTAVANLKALLSARPIVHAHPRLVRAPARDGVGQAARSGGRRARLRDGARRRDAARRARLRLGRARAGSSRWTRASCPRRTPSWSASGRPAPRPASWSVSTPRACSGRAGARCRGSCRGAGDAVAGDQPWAHRQLGAENGRALGGADRRSAPRVRRPHAGGALHGRRRPARPRLWSPHGRRA